MLDNMMTVTKSTSGVGTLTSKNERALAAYELHYPVVDLPEDSIQRASADSITGHVRPNFAISQTTLAEKGLLFEMRDRKLTFQFSFLNGYGEILFEKWVD
jgi:hypothetical protein